MSQRPQQLKLTYFDLPARAELTRLAFAFGGIAFEDERIDDAELETRRATMPLGQLPVLSVDGTMYAQSMALARYAGRLSGLYPTDALAALKIDMVLDSLLEALDAFIDIVFHTQDPTAKADKTQTFLGGALPKILAMIESRVEGSFIFGDSASLADLFAFDVVTNALRPAFADLRVAAFPKLAAVLANVQAIPNIAAYLAKTNTK